MWRVSWGVECVIEFNKLNQRKVFHIIWGLRWTITIELANEFVVVMHGQVEWTDG